MSLMARWNIVQVQDADSQNVQKNIGICLTTPDSLSPPPRGKVIPMQYLYG
jgi:hypothetical protein